MREIILWFNKYKKLILRVIEIFIITIILIKLLEFFWVKEQDRKRELIMSEINKQDNFNSISLGQSQSTVTGKSLTTTQTSSLKVLDDFIEYCNNNKMNDAYSLLSDDCKKQLYPTIDKFIENYYQKVFSGKPKSISVENWVGDIYKVKFMEDPLSTGVYNTQNVIQDHITVIKDEEKNTKININSYIGKQNINKEEEYKGVKIKVLEKHKYMDYEKYVFEVTNNSDCTILLSDSNNLNSMYLEDSNGPKYTAYIHEISEPELQLISGETKNVTIKYYNKYSSSKKIKNIVFSDIILNYDAYKIYKNQNIAYYKNYGTIKIEL